MGFLRGIAVGALLALATASPILEQRRGKDGPQHVTIDKQTKLPIVDLGYELHRAHSYNAAAGHYNFTNIRFGAPPVGDLRFRKPQPPSTNRDSVQVGQISNICPQASPSWQYEAANFVLAYLAGGVSAVQKRRRGLYEAGVATVESEDCLFLDVVVPKKVFERKGKGAPVLVWIYGGGYTDGSKEGSTSGDPEGLIERSNNGIIYVALNYRTGAFGFLGGPTLMKDGDANAGFWDQRLALKWVQDNISLFGGDPEQVTVIGESAGGGSIMHQITAFGGKEKALFKQAIPQSAGFNPIASDNQTESALAEFLRLAGVSTLAEARKLPTAKLQAANVQQVSKAPYGNFIYGPTIDGSLVPGLPAELLRKGAFAHDVRVLIGHNSNEGLVFARPNSVNVSTFAPNVEESLPTLPRADVDFLNATLYPADFSGTQPYTDDVERQAVASADIGFLCNAYALAKYTPHAYMYEVAVYPGLHGLDVPYTFYTGPTRNNNSTTSSAAAAAARIRRRDNVNEAALALQEWIVSFAMTGTPVGALGPAFPHYGAEQKILKLASESAGPEAAKDDISAARCEWWIGTGFVHIARS